jgi:hypothetical protein
MRRNEEDTHLLLTANRLAGKPFEKGWSGHVPFTPCDSQVELSLYKRAITSYAWSNTSLFVVGMNQENASATIIEYDLASCEKRKTCTVKHSLGESICAVEGYMTWVSGLLVLGLTGLGDQEKATEEEEEEEDLKHVTQLTLIQWATGQNVTLPCRESETGALVASLHVHGYPLVYLSLPEDVDGVMSWYRLSVWGADFTLPQSQWKTQSQPQPQSQLQVQEPRLCKRKAQ